MYGLGESVELAPELDRVLLDRSRDLAKLYIADGQVRPFALIQTPGAEFFVPALFTDERSRVQFAMIVRAAAVVHGATHVSMVSESWMVTCENPEEIKNYEAWCRSNPGASLEDYGPSFEVVHLCVESLAGRTLEQAKIIRGPDGTPFLGEGEDMRVAFQPVNSESWLGYTGTLTNLFPPKKLLDDPRSKPLAELYLTNSGAAMFPADAFTGRSGTDRVLQ